MTGEVCTECKSYAAEALGLCGDCLLKQGKSSADYDPVLLERKQIREAEIKSGKLSVRELEDAVLAARLKSLDRPPSIISQGMHKMPSSIGPQEPSDSKDNQTSEAKPK